MVYLLCSVSFVLKFIPNLSYTDIHSMVMETKEVTRSTLTSCLTKQKLPYLGGSQMGNSHILSDEDGYFNFIGRSKMSKLFQEIENMRVSRNPPPGAGERAAVQRDYENALWKKLLITGTPGFGKSYMLAALAYQLKREYYDRCFMHRVVYIPDCTNFVNDHFRKMKLALLIAFSSPDEIGSRLEVYSLTTEEDIERFCHVHKNLVFIVDQVNALTHQPAANDFFNHCTSSSIVIKCATITDHNSQNAISKQRCTKVLKMFGCMDKVCD